MDYIRKLVSVKKIDNILPIEGADRIELAQFGGWKVIVPKGIHKIDENVIYFEIDSFIPFQDILEKFLEPLKAKCTKTFDNKEGILIKTIKMKGQFSQGFVIPNIVNAELGTDLTEKFNVLKYEIPISSNNLETKSSFPEFIRKTDCIRIQNLTDEDYNRIKDKKFEITLKNDGTSFTNYYYNGTVGVCSRNLELKPQVSNLYTDQMLKELNDYKRNIAIQGEIIGPKIQNNPHNVNKNTLKIFNIWDIDIQCYLPQEERYKVLKDLNLFDKHIEIVDCKYQLKKPSDYSENLNDFVNKLLTEVQEKCGKKLEGFVLKSSDGSEIIKVISNEYL